jgi:hypothetical protein
MIYCRMFPPPTSSKTQSLKPLRGLRPPSSLKGKSSMKLFVCFLTLMFTLVFSSFAHAYVKPLRTDIKPATQVMMEKQTITDAEVADTDQVLETHAGPTAATALVISSFTAQPDVPRNITVTPTGTTTDVESCVVTIAGTNFFGAAISDTVTFAANASTVQATTKAFKTVTSVSFPADCESGTFAATWIVGVGDVLGMKRCMDFAGHVFHAVFDGVYEGTRPTCLADADEIEKNTCDINGTLNGAKDIELYFLQNWRCLP